MKLFAASEFAAQALADKAHAYLVEHDAGYAESVAAGRTTQWAMPTRELDDKGEPISDWHIPIEPRCIDAFDAAELEHLDAEGLQFMAARERKP